MMEWKKRAYDGKKVRKHVSHRGSGEQQHIRHGGADDVDKRGIKTVKSGIDVVVTG